MRTFILQNGISSTSITGDNHNDFTRVLGDGKDGPHACAPLVRLIQQYVRDLLHVPIVVLVREGAFCVTVPSGIEWAIATTGAAWCLPESIVSFGIPFLLEALGGSYHIDEEAFILRYPKTPVPDVCWIDHIKTFGINVRRIQLKGVNAVACGVFRCGGGGVVVVVGWTEIPYSDVVCLCRVGPSQLKQGGTLHARRRRRWQ